MPIYSYRCSSCDFIEEAFLDVKSRDKKFPCSQDGCTGIMVRDVDIPSFHLKGGGWFKDGYGSKKSKPKEEEK